MGTAAFRAPQGGEHNQAGRAAAHQQPDFQHLKAWTELRNMLLAARLIALAAVRRKESRGAHFRHDAP